MKTTTRNARKCEDCGQPFPLDGAPEDCPGCTAKRRREEARERREIRDRELRRLLAENPIERATTLARVALASAAEVLEQASTVRSATYHQADCLRRAAVMIASALNEIERTTTPAPGWVPRWPAP